MINTKIINDNQFICPTCGMLFFSIRTHFVIGERSECYYCETKVRFNEKVNATGDCVAWADLCKYDDLGGKCKECLMYED